MQLIRKEEWGQGALGGALTESPAQILGFQTWGDQQSVAVAGQILGDHQNAAVVGQIVEDYQSGAEVG